MQRGQREPKMERKTMNNRINSLKWWVLGCIMLFAGAQSAFAALACEGTVYFKLPEGWTSAYAVAGGQKAEFEKSTFANWLQVSASKIGGPNSAKGFVIEETGANDCNSGHCARKDSMNVKYLQISDNSATAFTCSDFGSAGELWISAHPDPNKANITYMSQTPPDVKYFYVFLPNNETWKSAIPLLVEDGKDHELELDEQCGWYFRRYIDEALPSKVLIRRDDDTEVKEAIGKDGGWQVEGSAAEPIGLEGMFALFDSDELFFVADPDEAAKLPSAEMGWYDTRPNVVGKCSYDLAALIYDTDASLHGAFTCNPDWSPGQTPAQAHANACYTASAKYQVASAGGEVPCIGVTKGMVESTLQRDATTGRKKMVLTTKGKSCFGAQAEEAFTAMFNYTPGVNEKYCFNMTFNQVSDGKFEFESDTYQSPGAPVVGGFYPAEEPPLDSGMTPGERPVMLSARLAAAENKRKAEGPIFFCADYNNQLSKSPDGLRTIHATEGVAMSDLICNGPGWDGGIDCEGLFAAGEEFKDTPEAAQITKKLGVTWEGDGWGWGCPNMGPLGWTYFKEGTETVAGKLVEKNQVPTGGVPRWTSGASDSEVLTKGGRNQHFCFESHASFRFKKGLKFSFRGDDDIWVFIDNKLAVDLGGTHLAAPGYVDLDKFMPDADVGTNYDIDIYFCDRRTTMSNVHIKTNMYIQQTTGITEAKNSKGEAQADYIENGNRHYSICYKKSSASNCAAEVDPAGGDRKLCGKEITDAGMEIQYELTTDPTGQDPLKVVVKAEDFIAQPKQFNGGIDVSKTYDPIVNLDKLKESLPANTYYLFIRIGNDSKAITIEVVGQLGVADRTAVAVDEIGNHSLPYEFIDRKMAAIPKDGAVDVDQLVPLYIAGLRDPCTTPGCTDPLEMRASTGSYSLSSSNANAVFYEMKNGKLSQIANPGAEREVNDGIDTVYVTILARSMGTKLEDSVSVNVVGSTRAAKVKFFVPQLVFVDGPTSTNIISSDPPSKIRMKGGLDTLYILALNADDTPCGEYCNFMLAQGGETSAGVDIIPGAEVVNGRGYVVVQSTQVYLNPKFATLDVSLAGAGNVHALYTNLQFQEPPVPTPQLADIYDVHGKVSDMAMNVDAPYFDAAKEYLDGIGDSLVVYYHRPFHKDSLPSKIEVFWENETDSVVFEKDEIAAGAICNTANVEPDYCEPIIKLGGKNLSKDIKTSGTGKLKSWATYKPTPTSDAITSAFDGIIYDRIAPVIVSALAMAGETGKNVELKVRFSEPVRKTTAGVAEGDKVFSFFINNGKTRHYEEFIDVDENISYGEQYLETQNLRYSQSSAVFPQAGDYIHFRSLNGEGLIADQSEYASAPGADSLRPAEDATHNWNVAPGYDATDRLPSPWVLITGDVSSYIVRLIPSAKGGIPTNHTPAEIEKLPVFTVMTYDANKNENDFRKDIRAGGAGYDAYGYIPHGWFVKSDMGALKESKEEFADADLANIYFDYEFQLFTNLGGVVANQKGRVYCNDKDLFGGNCVKNRRNIVLVWNMKSNDNRMVGSGAYISKVKTFVQLDKYGKKNKLEKSEMWGVRHNANEVGSLPPLANE